MAGMPNRTAEYSVIIADTANLSGEADLQGKRLVKIRIPAGMEGSVLTFQDEAGGTYADLYNSSGEVSYPISTGARSIAVNPSDFAGCVRIKARSGTSASPSPQTGAATLILVAQDL